jgi:DNA polymerase-3 subunit delta
MAREVKAKPVLYTEEKLASELKNKISGAFVFFGDEDYVKEHYLGKIRKKILTAEGFETFNHFTVSFSPVGGASADELFSRLADAVDAFPMFQEQKLVEIRDLSLMQISPKNLESLISVLTHANTLEDTVTVLNLRESEYVVDYKTEQSATYKKLAAAAKAVRFDAYPPEKLAAWEKKQLAARGLFIAQDAALMLADMCACRMLTVCSEFAKLEAYAAAMGKNTVTAEDVRAVCAISEREEAPFALSNAAEKWNIKEVLSAVYDLRDLKKEPVAILARFSGIFENMLFAKTAREAGRTAAELAKLLKTSEARAARLMSSVGQVPLAKLESCVDEAYRTDLLLKSSSADPWVVMETFIAKVYTPRSLL